MLHAFFAAACIANVKWGSYTEEEATLLPIYYKGSIAAFMEHFRQEKPGSQLKLSGERRIVIFTGGSLGSWALAYIKPGDCLIGADRGALFLVDHGFSPQLAIGDFDSVSLEELQRIRAASGTVSDFDAIDKNHTDTEMAFHAALGANPDEIILVGAIGSRLDHSLANLQLLALAADRGVAASVVNENNRLRLLTASSPLTISRDEEGFDFTHVSLLPFTSAVSGINLNGFKYPLHNATLAIGQSRGISNELDGQSGTIQIKNGQLLVICSRD